MHPNTTIRTGARRGVAIMGACVATALLAGCQEDGPPAVSLDEARKITATFEGQSFVPPPKTLVDITKILDEQKRDKVADEQAALADAKPPETADRAELASFYVQRGSAAFEIGRTRQAIADLSRANTMVDALSGGDRVDMLNRLGAAEVQGGDRRKGLRHMREAVDVASPVRAVLLTSTLAYMNARMGNPDQAESWLGDAENRLNEFRYGTGRMANIWNQTGALMLASTEWGTGTVATAMGRFGTAETALRSALAYYDRAKREMGADFRYPLAIRERMQSDLGEALMAQGRVIEAEVEVRAALLSSLRRQGRYGQMSARNAVALARIMSGQNRPRDAEALSRASIEIFEKIGNEPGSALVLSSQVELAVALAAQDRWNEVLALFDATKSQTDDSDTWRERIGTSPLYSLALLRNGRAGDALKVAHEAVELYRAKLGDKHDTSAEARGVLAQALAATGDHAAALDSFRGSIPILLQRSRRSGNEEGVGRDRRLREILEAYIGALGEARGAATARARGIDPADESFRIADVARGQSVQRALLASAARAAAKEPELADLARREQDALKRIGALNALYVEAVSVPTEQQNATAITSLHTRIDRLRGARAAIAEEIERRFPDYAALMNPKPATLAEARHALHAGETLIATYVADEKTYVWAVPKSGPAEFAAAPLGRDQVAAVTRTLRRALDPQAASLGDIPAFDVGLSHRLYGALLGPVAAAWKDAKSLLIVADGALGQLPFSVLVAAPARLGAETAPLFHNYRAVPWLARTHAVTVLPSVSSLATLRRLPPGRAARRSFAGFGDPWFSPDQAGAQPARTETDATALASRGLLAVRGMPVSLRAAPRLDGVASADLARLPRLPDTADEVRSIAIALDADLSRDVFTGRAASEGKVKTLILSGYKVIAFATHGLVPGDLDGLVQPALALTSPKVAGGADDGLLTMGEILGLRLDADWVVLSACNTASGAGAGAGAGAEAISGLGRAFFYAGTRALLVSNWPVETTSARALTTDLFRRQAADAAITRSEALRRAMLGLIDGPGLTDREGRSVFSYAHPIFWAPFSLVGDGGGTKAGS